MNNIILIGMPSSGKSTLGRLLAKRLGYAFLDTDDVIRQRNGCDLQDIIDRDGLEAFNRREEEAVCSVEAERTVIATGGSVIYSPVSMAHLKALGRVVYLAITYGMLERRVGDPRARGIAIAPGRTLRELYEERAPLYEQYADLTVGQSEQDRPEASAEQLMKLLG